MSLQLSPIPGPPAAPGRLNAVLGNLSDLSDNQYHRTTTRWSEKYGGICRLRFLDKHVILIADPVIACEMLKDKSMDKSTRAYAIMNALFDDKGHSGLLTSQMTPRWRAVRKAVASALSPQTLRASFPKLRTVAQRLVEKVRLHGPDLPVDMDLLCAQLSWDIIGIVGFDTDMGATKESGHDASSGTIATVRAGMQEIEQRWGQPYRAELWKYLLPAARKGERDLKAVHVIIRDLLTKLRKVDPESLGNTIAGQLLRLKDPQTGQLMSDDVLMPEIGTMFLAGFETSGHTEAWALYLISQHPEVEERILQELADHQLMPTKDGSLRDMQYEDLGRLTYLNAVIKETLRMYPAGPSTDRLAHRDMQVGGYFIPKGTIFWISLYTMQNLPSIHDDPAAFKPERWFDPDYLYLRTTSDGVSPIVSHSGQAKPHSTAGDSSPKLRSGSEQPANSWLDVGKQTQAAAEVKEPANQPKRWFPFSEGPRSCVGQTLANMNVTGTLATLLAHYHFRLADQMGGQKGVQESESVAITLAPSKGLFMHAESRLIL
ncbi:hypothetical protein WJX79_000879 [Trebouxia sp. C0005]